MVRRNAAASRRHRPRLRNADLFVAIGTSGAVYPAAGFVADARAYGVPTCEINLEAADNADCFDEARYGPASETVPVWVDEMLETWSN